jgi:glucodextranase-like protein
MTRIRTLTPAALLTVLAAVIAGCGADTPANADTPVAGAKKLRLSITTPRGATTTRATAVHLSGRVTLGATVRVNGDTVAVAGKRFSARVPLTIGKTRLRIVAIKNGYATKRRSLTVIRTHEPRPVSASIPASTPTPQSTPEPTPDQSCHPSYEGACLDPTSYDYDCEGGSGDGPDYTGTVRVVGDDPYDLDRDGDGTACDA